MDDVAVALLKPTTMTDRDAVANMVARLHEEEARATETPLLRLDLPAVPNIPVYLKDETRQPTGSLKHRLARSLFMHGLVSGRIGPDSTIIEASSGSTAVSEAYFARLLGLPFVAVVPRTTSPAKLALIEAHGGECHLVEPGVDVREESQRLAVERGGVFIDQFTYAERASDWQGRSNIGAAILDQLVAAGAPELAWVVAGAGTGGTITTIGRHLRYRGLDAKICLVDPDRSVLHRHCNDRAQSACPGPASLVEGIGRQRVEASFLPALVDRWLAVPDAASIAAARGLSRLLGRECGGSTGTAFWGVATVVAEMARTGRSGAVVFLCCDGGERYASSYFNDTWVRDQALDLAPFATRLNAFVETGRFAN
ncbi:cysteine synthase [Acuticoccus sediminis]|uniref:cystathionine gamma-lyase n=1 Tax=Acuticoccus sediminis TaxID=2184697 RepID=A0A8B2NQ41_9HYPH|nr:cysteine synthase [Acuticoccus sediminis]